MDVVDGGIDVFSSNRNRIQRNHLQAEGYGVGLTFADESIVRGNFVQGPIVGIGVNQASRNLIERNWVERTTATGIRLSDFGGDNSVVANVVRRSGGDGVFVDSTAVRAVIERNRSDRNGDDGIDVDTIDATITANRADRNGDLGIEAFEGVTDGGGNRARGNRNRLQCTGVRYR